MKTLSRRRFIQTSAGLAVVASANAAPTVARASQAKAAGIAGFRGNLCFFSKHLPRMNARELAQSLKALGFDGVDLTVRPGGHVDPKKVAAELPAFVDAIRHEGMAVPMITTE